MASDRQLELALVVKAQLDQARKQLNGLERELRGTGSAGKGAGRDMKTFGADTDQAERKAGKFANTMEGVNKKLHLVNRAAHDLRNAFVFAFAAHEVVNLTRSLVDANVEAQRIHYTFEQAFGQEAQSQLKFVRDLSDELGLNFKQTAAAFGQIGASAQGTGVDTKDLQVLFRGLAEAATVLHTPAEELNATFIQLAQGISLGTLQMQDIRAIAQHLPGTMSIMQEAAKRLGTTLEDALAHGGLDARKAIVAIGEVAHERFGKQAKEASHSLNSELNRLHTTLFKLQTDGTGFADTFAEGIRELADSLNDQAVQQGIKSLVRGLSQVVTWSVKVAAKLGDAIAGIDNFAQHLAALDTGHIEGSPTQQQIDQAAVLEKRKAMVSGYQRDAGTLHLGAIPGVQHNGQDALNYVAQLAHRSASASIDDSLSQVQQQRQFEVLAALKRSNDEFIQTYSGSTDQLVQKMVTITRAGNLVLAKTLSRAQDRQKRVQILDQSGALNVLPGQSPGKTAGKVVTPDPDARKKAAALTKSAAAANQQLRDSFIALQAAQDPTAAAWARYNQVVDNAAKAETKANDALDKKVKLGALSVAAANAQKAANAGLVRGIKVMAAATRDAAIDKLADKDRKAWEQFRASLQTPLEAHVNDAVAAIDMLNKHMAKGKMTADQYQGLVDRIFAKAAGQGSLRRVHTAGPAGGILDTQTQESADYQRQMDLIAGIRDKVLADEQTSYAQRLAAQRAYEQASDRLTQLHAQNQQALERQKAQFALQAAQAGFGALAQAAAQAYGEHSKQARIAFALQKAAAVASAALAIQQSIANSAKIGYPWNIVAIAGAIAQGVAVLASVRSVQPGFAEGGYTGSGGKYQVAGVVHAGEGVLSQRDMAALGGPRAFDDFRRGLHGYADGGFVHPLANAPSPAQLGFSAPRLPKLAMPDASAAAGSGGAHHVKVVVVSNMEQAAIEAMNTPAGHKVIVQTAGDNPNAIKGKWGS